MQRTTAAARVRAVSKLLCTLALAFVAQGMALAAEPEIGGDVVVVAVQGNVQGANKRGKLELPARLRTGADSSVELRQGRTTISVTADTELEIAATKVAGRPIERVKQIRGNAFYNVGKREQKKFRVETPYLVAVVKGTQFNVAVHEASATISLFEGQLEIQTLDGNDVIDLIAGQIATRSTTEVDIRVLRMDTGAPIAQTPVETVDAIVSVSDGAAVEPRVPPAVAELVVDTAAETHTARVDANVDLGRASVDLGPRAGVDLSATPAAPAAIAATVDVGAATVDVGPNTRVDVDPGIGVGSNTGVDVGANVDIGSSAVNVDVGASADLGNGAVAADVNVGGLDVGLDVDLDNGTIDIDNSGPGSSSSGSGSGHNNSSGPGNDDGLVGDVLDGVGGLLRRTRP